MKKEAGIFGIDQYNLKDVQTWKLKISRKFILNAFCYEWGLVGTKKCFSYHIQEVKLLRMETVLENSDKRLEPIVKYMKNLGMNVTSHKISGKFVREKELCYDYMKII